MVATASRIDCLGRADAALAAAVSDLLDALTAFHAAGRPDLAYLLRSAVAEARQVQVLRRVGAPAGPDRDPADWFLD